jgi:hypothetical protein
MTHYVNYWTLAFFLEVVVAYLSIINVQWRNMVPANARLTVLSVRSAVFMPLYAMFIYISLIEPQAFVGLLIPITVVEGYVFYTFAVLVVTNLGGAEATVQLLKDKDDIPLKSCGSCPCYKSHSEDPKKFYETMTWGVFHFFFTRTFLTFLAVVSFYSGTVAGYAFFKIFSILSAAVLVYAILTFILFCKSSLSV